MTKIAMIEFMRSLLKQEHKNGLNDCNLVFFEIFYPEYADKIRGKYSSSREGFRVAKKEIGYTSARDVILNSGDWFEIDLRYARTGDVFIKGQSVAICVGKVGIVFDEYQRYQVVPIQYIEAKLYRKKE